MTVTHYATITTTSLATGVFLTAKLAPMLLTSGRKDNRAIYLGKKKKGRSSAPIQASRKTNKR